MHPDGKHEQWKAEFKYTDIRVAHLPFGYFDLPQSHSMVQVTFRVDVVFVLVLAVSIGQLEVLTFLCASSVAAYSLLCHCIKEGSHLFDFHKQ